MKNQMEQSMAEQVLSTDTEFCRSLVKMRYLSQDQMLRAAQHYKLGKSKDGGVIFWEIDEQQKVRDGKIMFYKDDCHRDHSRTPDWVSYRLKSHYGYEGDVPIERCLFGLHLLEEGGRRKEERDYSASDISHSTFHIPHSTKSVAIVEAEKTAVICSELFPQAIWLASGGLTMLNAAKLYPLRNCKTVLFPDTDPEGKAYAAWKSVADIAQEHFKYPIRVSSILESHASSEQKVRKIDLVDYLFDRGTCLKTEAHV